MKPTIANLIACAWTVRMAARRLLILLTILALSAGSANSTRLYIYPLRPNLTDCGSGWSKSNYGAEQSIPQLGYLPCLPIPSSLRRVDQWQALRESPHTVSDPTEADLFLVPAVFYCLTEGTVFNFSEFGQHRQAYHQVIWKVLEVVREQPFFDIHQGRDHIFTLTFDNGYCGFHPVEGPPEVLQHSIILSHWGLIVPEDRCPKHEWLKNYERCRRPPKYPLAPGTLPCHRPDKDVVVPSTTYDDLIQRFPEPLEQFAEDFLKLNLTTPGSTPAPVPRNASWPALPAMKRTLLQFVGETHHDIPNYSHGVRQAVMQLNNTPGFELAHSSFAEALSREESRAHAHASLFCLATSGTGFGTRLKQAAVSGCIPLVIDDHVRFEYEDILPYADFTVRVPQQFIYLLPEILEQLVADQPEKLEVMVRRQACVATLLSWAPNGIGKAVDVLMCALSGRGLHRKHTRALVDWERCKVTCEVGHLQLP